MKRMFSLLMAGVLLCSCLVGCKEKSDLKKETFSGLPISVEYHSELLAEDAARLVAKFYYAIQIQDAELYKSVLSNEYLAYTELYFENTGYSYAQLMEQYYQSTAAYLGGVDFTTTSVKIKAVKRDDDVQQVMNAMDQIAEQLWQKKTSQYYEDAFSVSCDVTVQSTVSDEQYTMEDSVLYLIKTDGKYLMIVYS